MSSLDVFGVYTAQIPFLGTQGAKVRPVIVVSKSYGQHGVIAIIPISSKVTRETVDTAIDSWKAAGLMKSSIARVHRLTTMLQSDLIAELGKLEMRDVDAIKASVKTFLSL